MNTTKTNRQMYQAPATSALSLDMEQDIAVSYNGTLQDFDGNGIYDEDFNPQL